MKPEPVQDELQRILALKRQERPPQRVINKLSTSVIDRIQHPEPPPPPTFRQRMGLDFDGKPVLICVSGAVVCGLLAYALISSGNVQAPPPIPTDASSLSVAPSSRPDAPPVIAPGTKIEPPNSPTGGTTATPVSMEVRPWPAPPRGGK